MLYPVFTAAFMLSTYYSAKKFDQDSAGIGFLRYDMAKNMVQKGLSNIGKALDFYSGKYSPELLEMVHNSLTVLDELPSQYVYPRIQLLTAKNALKLCSTILNDFLFSKIINNWKGSLEAINMKSDELLEYLRISVLKANSFLDGEGGSLTKQLHRSIFFNHIDDVELLIKNGADVNGVNANGFTPLRAATLLKHEDVAKLLVKYGAAINNDEMPLHMAISKELTELAKLLIEKGADVKAENAVGFTPLHVAVICNSKEIVKLLLENGADAFKGTESHFVTPLSIAVQDNRLEIVKILVEKASPNNFYPLLEDAEFYGHKSIVEVLAKKAAESKTKDVNKKTFFGNAGTEKSHDVVKEFKGEPCELTKFGKEIAQIKTIKMTQFYLKKSEESEHSDSKPVTQTHSLRARANVEKLTEQFAGRTPDSDFKLEEGEIEVRLNNGKKGRFDIKELVVFKDEDTSASDLAMFAFEILAATRNSKTTSCEHSRGLLEKHHIDEAAFVDFLVEQAS